MLCRTLQGHGHWVNTMALNTDYAIRTGPFDPVQMAKNKNMTGPEPLSEEELKQKAFERYQTAKVLLLIVVFAVVLRCCV